MATELYYGIPAYNEEANILNCLGALDNQTVNAKVETIIGIGECSDRTKEKVLEGTRKFPNLNIRIIKCGTGKSVAQRSIADSVENRKVPIAFVDADVIPHRKCLEILYNDLNRIDRLIVVGARPMPMQLKKSNPLKGILFDTLNARALNPESEISANDVSRYKWYADRYPQHTITPEFEKRSKIFFHGRTFMMKSADYMKLPAHKNVADDTYLPNFIHTKHGPGTIRVRYDALVYYKPYVSLRKHFNTYWRVYSDLRAMDGEGLFEESRRMEKTKLDWDYIISKGARITAMFLMYSAIKSGEQLCYKLMPKRTLAEIWKDEKIEELNSYNKFGGMEVKQELAKERCIAQKSKVS